MRFSQALAGIKLQTILFRALTWIANSHDDNRYVKCAAHQKKKKKKKI